VIRSTTPQTFASLALLVCSICLAGVAARAEQRHLAGDEVILAADETVAGDLVANGRRVEIRGTVEGDLVVSAQQLEIAGHIGGDVLAAAVTIEIRGTVDDDLRAAAFAVRLHDGAVIGDHASVAAYSFESEPGSRVSGDLGLRAAQARLAGRSEHGVDFAGRALEIDGAIAGPVHAELRGEEAGLPPALTSWITGGDPELPTLPPGLTIGDLAELRGPLSYEAVREARVDPAALLAQAPHFERLDAPSFRSEGGASIDWLAIPRRFLSFFAVGALLVWALPSALPRLVGGVRSRPLPALGYGLGVALAVTILAAVIAAVMVLATALAGALTLGGLVPPLIGLALLLEMALLTPTAIIVIYLPPAVAGLLIGSEVLARWQPELDVASRPYRSLAIGVAIYTLLSLLPGIGTLLSVLVVLAGIGALAMALVGDAESEPAEAL